MTESEYPAFPPIKRLRRGMTITEKIDGTNGLIRVSEGNHAIVIAGSRNRWLSPGKDTDNFGFAKWVEENADNIALDLGPGDHYGEWWGAGIQRRYGFTSDKWFSLFNAARWAGRQPPFVTPHLCVVPVLYIGDFSTSVVDYRLRELAKYGSKARPGFMEPEGIVVWHHATRTYAKVTLDGDGAKGKR